MSLQKRLENISKASASKFDDASKAIAQRAAQELKDSGILDRALGVGATAPAFALSGSQGDTVDSAALLRQGPLVLTFFRGHW